MKASMCRSTFTLNLLLKLALRIVVFSAALSALAGPVPDQKPAHYPDWWFTQDVILRLDPDNETPTWPTDYPAADDYAAINQGQVKNIAKQAYEGMKANGLVDPVANPTNPLALLWENPATGTDDYAAINLGQLKFVAAPFYDQLIAADLATAYPWTTSESPADDYALANIGQAKYLFGFSLNAIVVPEPVGGGLDSDGDGIPDYWELLYGFDPFDPDDGTGQLAAYQRQVASLGQEPESANELGLIVYTP